MLLNIAEGEYRVVSLDSLPTDLPGPEPTPAFIASVRAMGVMQPVLLIETANGYEVAAGRRRIKAARACGMAVIPAIVFLAGTVNPQSIAVIENRQRSENLRSDYLAIKQALSEGHTEAELMVAFGMSKPEFRRVMQLDRLTEPLRAKWDAGQMTTTTAAKAAKLPANLQDKLTGEKVTGQDVHEARNAAPMTLTIPAMAYDPLEQYSTAELLAEMELRGYACKIV